MTNDELWKRISTIKRDPCIPRYEQKTFVTTNNPYTSDGWGKLRKEFIDYMRSDIGREDRVYSKEDALRKMLEDCKNSTEADAKFVAAQLENHGENDVKKMLEYGRRTNMNFNIQNIREALARYGYVTNCEVTMSGLNHAPTMHIELDLTGAYFDRGVRPTFVSNPKLKKVMFNGPATIVYWSDDIKTIVKCMEDEEFDPEKGLAMAICKRLYGGNFHRVFKDALKNAETRKGDEVKRARKLRVTRAKIKEKKNG